ncbi:MFS monosaccharide transporter [Colletotrichum musicola]|uniref:MFS monosaccharide transporter n=1 Tax=Colletotrichum musicola TaxID=2175873 RepID=A0A8H6IVY7_9PEZI|nr:MFS monosaccharide transporter [Colletotrichum musicola]
MVLHRTGGNGSTTATRTNRAVRDMQRETSSIDADKGHDIGDGQTPCSGCEKSESDCVRVNNRFRFKRLVASQKKYSFDVDQPWLHTSSSFQSQKPLAIVDVSKPNPDRSIAETSLPGRNTDTLPPIQPRPTDQLTAAAEVLQSFSQTEPRTSIELSSLITDPSQSDDGLGQGSWTPSGSGEDDESQISPDAFQNHQPGATPAACQVIEYNGIPLPDLNKDSAVHYHSKCISYLMNTSTDPDNPCNDDALTAITILRYHEQVDTHLTGSDSETYIRAIQAVFHAQQEDKIGLFSILYHPPRGPDIYAPTMSSLRHSATLIALRHEIWSVLLYRRPFRLPLYGTEDCSQFDTDVADDFDWANRILVWCAYALKFCFGTSPDDPADVEDTKSRAEQWNALKAFEQNWDTHLPPHYRSLAYQDRDPARGEYFPKIWHANDCQVIAQQHVELTRIVLAVHDAKNQRLGIGARAASKALEELLLGATRKICGLALSNGRDQPAMVIAGVGISLCGEYFHDEGEQRAILEFMDNLERLHAWPTSSVVDALRAAWDGRPSG